MKLKTMFFTSITTIIVCVLIGLAIVHYLKSNNTEETIMKIAVFGSGLSDTYYFMLKDDFILQSYFGERKSDDIGEKNFLKKIYKEEEKQLNEKENEAIMNLANQLKHSNYSELNLNQNWDDVWYVSILLDGKVYQACHSAREVKLLSELADKIIQLSPIEVELREFA